MQVDTLVGKNSKIVGNILYTGGVHIEGEIEGNLMAEEVDKGFVVVSESGFVKGEIRGPSIIVYGTVKTVMSMQPGRLSLPRKQN